MVEFCLFLGLELGALLLEGRDHALEGLFLFQVSLFLHFALAFQHLNPILQYDHLSILLALRLHELL